MIVSFFIIVQTKIFPSLRHWYDVWKWTFDYDIFLRLTNPDKYWAVRYRADLLLEAQATLNREYDLWEAFVTAQEDKVLRKTNKIWENNDYDAWLDSDEEDENENVNAADWGAIDYD